MVRNVLITINVGKLKGNNVKDYIYYDIKNDKIKAISVTQYMFCVFHDNGTANVAYGLDNIQEIESVLKNSIKNKAIVLLEGEINE